MKFIANTLTTFSARIITVILGFIVSIIIARTLGPEGKGYYSLLILVPSMLIQFGNLGIGISNTYFTGSKKINPQILTSNSVYLSAILGSILFIGFMLYYHLFQPVFLTEIDSGHLLLVSLVIPFALLKTYFTAIVLGQQRIRAVNVITIIHSFVSFIFIILLLVVFDLGLIALVIAWMVAEIVTAVFCVLVLWGTASLNLTTFKFRVFYETLKFGVVGYTGNVIQFFNYRLDMLLIAHFLSATIVGYYSVSVSMAEALWYLPAAVGTVIFASTSNSTAEQSNRNTPMVCRNTLFITFILALLLFAVSSFIIPLLYGQEFLPAVRPLWILLPGVVALSICKVLANEMTGRGRPKISLLASVITLGVNIPLNLILIPQMGMNGGAIATSVAYIVSSIIVLLFFIRVSKNRISDVLILKRSDVLIYTRFIRSVQAEATKKKIL